MGDAGSMVLIFFVGLPVLMIAALAIIKPHSRLVWIANVLFVVTYLFFFSRAGTGWHVPAGPGEFYVVHGGNTEAMNHHSPVPAQRFALDLVALNGFGARADGISPTENSAFAIYGAPVRAPCNGRVLIAVDGFENNEPGQTDLKNLAGNHLAIHCEKADVTVLLAHLEKNSLVPKAGKKVRQGEELGAVGNSGNSSEPHLHIHVVGGKVSDEEQLLKTAEALPMTFGGRFLVRNDQIVVR